MPGDHYREWHLICPSCPDQPKRKVWGWQSKLPYPCPACSTPLEHYIEPRGSAPGIVKDSIEGGVWIRHGICNPDGTPKRYDSMTDIKRAANEAGYTIHGDTPKPYGVGWSGKVNGKEQ